MLSGLFFGNEDPPEFRSMMFMRLTELIERVKKRDERDFYRDVLHKEV